MLKIYNSLTRAKETFTPISPGKVGMYVCGMTVYDYCHLGHARFMAVFDLVKRWLVASGFETTYVRNITDIDDKIIKRAAENNEPIEKLTNRFIEAMNQDAAALGVQKPDVEPRATANVPEMVRLIAALIDRTPGLPGAERRRLLLGAQIPRLRQVIRQDAGRTACRRARGSRWQQA